MINRCKIIKGNLKRFHAVFPVNVGEIDVNCGGTDIGVAKDCK